MLCTIPKTTRIVLASVALSSFALPALAAESSRRSSHELRPLTPPYKRCRIRRFRLSFYQLEPMVA